MEPLTLTFPAFCPSSPRMAERREDFPTPTVPTTATKLPLTTFRLIFSRVGFSYSKRRVIIKPSKGEPETFKRMIGWDSWSSGYGRRLVSERLWVWIQVPEIRWNFFTVVCYKIVFTIEKKNKCKKRSVMGQYKRYKITSLERLFRQLKWCIKMCPLRSSLSKSNGWIKAIASIFSEH